MNERLGAYARFGAPPLFASRISAAPAFFPGWDDVEREIRGIFERRYFANNGPLVQALDASVAEIAGTRHAVAVTNEMMAAVVLFGALPAGGDVIVPAIAPASILEAIRWAGLRPVLCDVAEGRFVPARETLESLAEPRTRALYACRGFAGAAEFAALDAFCTERDIALLIGGGDDLGATSQGKATTFSFGAGRLVNAAEGATIVTDDDALAAALRTIRNFHAGETFAPVRLRINGKMSEAQAALALASLRRLAPNVEANRERYARYAHALAGIRGVVLIPSEPGGNLARIAIAVDEETLGISRDRMLQLLEAENVGARVPFVTALAGYPAADRLAQRLIELPNGSAVALADAGAIGELIGRIASDAVELSRALPA